ncbi:FliH/SctL family protein [Alphaproteobacteria bacterium]|nr:FliH/SctL family protein [Alphaproteobacteria bacterium]
MSLKIKYEDEKDNTNNENVVSLGNDQIKSVLKTQSQAVFQDKNISNNSNFVKKSLIDIALDFETKKENENNVSNETISDSISLNETGTYESKTQQIETLDETDNNDSLQAPEEIPLTIESTDKKDLLIKDKVEDQIDLAKDKNYEDITNKQSIIENQYNEEQVKDELTDDNSKKIDLKSEDKKDEESSVQALDNNTQETQQALNSVRDAVSQSINKSDNETAQTTENINLNQGEVGKAIVKDIEDYKSIFSSLSSMSEKAIYDAIENKILDIANELAGYQIDKMPDKYEKKIKTFLKNINCFEEKITIEVNDKDLEALSKIEDFQNINQKSQFVPNKDISRGDIVLNCDGMHYSEKTFKKD